MLFTIGEFLIGMYLGKASFGSTYGAAGSVIIVLVWVHYSAQIFFFGAEFTEVYASQLGSDPNRKRKTRLAAETSKTAKFPEREYAQTASGQTGGATATAGSLVATALAITKVVHVFLSKR